MLVTGGAGFIGANFALDTLRRYPDAQVTVLDALTYDLVDRLVSECDTVVHLAAESHVDNSIHDPSPFIRSNIIGTFTLLEAVRRHERRLHPTIRPLLRGQRPKLYGAGVNVREWTHVDDHNDAVHRIITDGRIGHTYLVGSGDERSNKQIVELILDLMG
ncbi:MAG: GDP-mannose 4,6-dehydratase, partial [Dactylosporangium sp.]|nr:GDP-mannose 4,6-dehydratase [Dactylosporangium sp.]